MGRAPCCEKQGLKRGPWSPEEDKLLVDYIQAHGYGTWKSLPRLAGLLRCGKSCRLRWTNYLRPDIKRGAFTPEEERSILHLHHILGNKWSTIAANLEGRTDNEVKNYWNTHLKKRQLLLRMPLTTTTTTTTNPRSPEPSTDFFLRIWNSPIGDAFRKPVSTNTSSIAAAPAAAAPPPPPPPPPPHTSPLQSSNITTSNEAAAAAAVAAAAASEEEEEENSYRDYFNFAAGGDDLGFFFFDEGQMESS